MKIVEFISTLKLSSEYFPLAKHCIYSADNDFLLLGIATRELNVTLIQEVFYATNYAHIHRLHSHRTHNNPITVYAPGRFERPEIR